MDDEYFTDCENCGKGISEERACMTFNNLNKCICSECEEAEALKTLSDSEEAQRQAESQAEYDAEMQAIEQAEQAQWEYEQEQIAYEEYCEEEEC